MGTLSAPVTKESAIIQRTILTFRHYHRASGVMNSFAQVGVRTSSLARKELERQEFFGGMPERLKVVLVSAESLGLPEGVRYDKIFRHGIKLGLNLCPWQTAYQYRLLTANNQRRGQHVIVVSERFSPMPGNPMFAVTHHEDKFKLILQFCGGRSKQKVLFLFVDP